MLTHHTRAGSSERPQMQPENAAVANAPGTMAR
jgi:hypothetical protein